MDVEYETLATATSEDGVLEVTLTRPDLMNRFDAPLHRELCDVFSRLATERSLRAVILASTGRVFSAGGDFELIRRCHDDPVLRAEILDEGRKIVASLLDLPVPLIAALHGDAVGAAANIVLGSDVVVAARDARIWDPHVVLGLVAGDGGCLMWPQSAGMLRARRYLLTGEPIQAEDAYAMGLVTDLVDDPDDVIGEARRIATRIAELPPLGVRGTKQALNRVMQQRAGEVMELAIALEGATAASEDTLEAIAAFEARRTGIYRGR
jgi:enoyl-CoA hydratase